MPRPNDSPDVKASKALAYILRHGAEKEGLDMRSDGYLKLTDVVRSPGRLALCLCCFRAVTLPSRGHLARLGLTGEITSRDSVNHR